MKVWKVILATIVIFAAGAFAGGLFVKTRTVQGPPPYKPPVPGIISQQHFQARLKNELQLSLEQTNRIDRIFAESNARIKIIWDLLGPEVQKERQVVYENIRAELSPGQREKFELLLKESPRRPEGQRRGPRNTNQVNSAGAPPK